MKNRELFVSAALGLLAAVALLGVAAAQAQDSAEGLVPTVRILYPNVGSTSARNVPPTLNAQIEGSDADAMDGRPWKYRYLWIPAETPAGNPILVRSQYDQYVDELILWDDARWSAWLDYPQEGEAPQVSFPGLDDGSAWFLTAQVMDFDGAVSLGRGYQLETLNVVVRTLAFVPQVVLQEEFLGRALNYFPSSQVAIGQPLTFSWIADASFYNGEIVSYRHGWDLIDPDDEMDPGWEVPAGTAPENLYAQTRSFSSGGLHYFYLRVADDIGYTVMYRWTLDVIPFVSYEMQLPLAFVDQVVDDNSMAWQDEFGNPRDNAIYRDAYWQFLDGQDGVAGFDWQRDRFGHEQIVRYEDVVRYRAVLCSARMHSEQTMMSQFRAVNGEDRYVWLNAYQAYGGNLMLVGNNSLDSFVEARADYWVPFLFSSTSEPVNGYLTSFGYDELPDGSNVARGPRMYHSATVGIEALDWSTTNSKTAYGRSSLLTTDRRTECAGLKALTLDDAFRTEHLIGPGVLPDTLRGAPHIDWQDYADAAAGTLELDSSVFPFRGDEFVDADISPRGAVITPQTCVGAPDNRCLEPMFRGISRMDYIREYKWAQGDTDWPEDVWPGVVLEELICGQLALTDHEGRPYASAKTNAQVYGYLSHKTADTKPSGRADVYWGFDPYRFDHEQSRQAVRWVLDYFGLELNQ